MLYRSKKVDGLLIKKRKDDESNDDMKDKPTTDDAVKEKSELEKSREEFDMFQKNLFTGGELSRINKINSYARDINQAYSNKYKQAGKTESSVTDRDVLVNNREPQRLNYMGSTTDVRDYTINNSGDRQIIWDNDITDRLSPDVSTYYKNVTNANASIPTTKYEQYQTDDGKQVAHNVFGIKDLPKSSYIPNIISRVVSGEVITSSPKLASIKRNPKSDNRLVNHTRRKPKTEIKPVTKYYRVMADGREIPIGNLEASKEYEARQIQRIKNNRKRLESYKTNVQNQLLEFAKHNTYQAPTGALTKPQI